MYFFSIISFLNDSKFYDEGRTNFPYTLYKDLVVQELCNGENWLLSTIRLHHTNFKFPLL